jgi:hypothetical protein
MYSNNIADGRTLLYDYYTQNNEIFKKKLKLYYFDEISRFQNMKSLIEDPKVTAKKYTYKYLNNGSTVTITKKNCKKIYPVAKLDCKISRITFIVDLIFNCSDIQKKVKEFLEKKALKGTKYKNFDDLSKKFKHNNPKKIHQNINKFVSKLKENKFLSQQEKEKKAYKKSDTYKIEKYNQKISKLKEELKNNYIGHNTSDKTLKKNILKIKNHFSKRSFGTEKAKIIKAKLLIVLDHLLNPNDKPVDFSVLHNNYLNKDIISEGISKGVKDEFEAVKNSNYLKRLKIKSYKRKRQIIESRKNENTSKHSKSNIKSNIFQTALKTAIVFFKSIGTFFVNLFKKIFSENEKNKLNFNREL